MADFPIVGIGSSAGGLEALQKLFDAMPPDSGLAFIVAAHLDPTAKSHLTELLGRRTKMPVVQIESEIDGRARPRLRHRARPGADAPATCCMPASRGSRAVTGARSTSFFRSLAEDQRRAGDRASCCRAPAPTARWACASSRPKAASRIAQDPGDGGFAGMPQSAIATGVVDLVLPPEKMPEALLDLARHPYVRQPAEAVEQPDARGSADRAAGARCARRTKHDFSSYRRQTLLRRIHRRMGLHQIESLADYLQRLRDDPQEVSALARDLTINVSGFFRDPEAWKVLDEKVVAPLVRGARRRTRRSGSGCRAARPARRPTRSRC